MSVIVSLAIFCAAAAQGDATPAVKAADTSATKKAAIRALSGRQLDKAAHAACAAGPTRRLRTCSRPGGNTWPSTRTCNATRPWPSPPAKNSGQTPLSAGGGGQDAPQATRSRPGRE